LLYVTTAHRLRATATSRILWLSLSGASTTDHIRQGLKKMGASVGEQSRKLAATAFEKTSTSTFVDASERLTIRCVSQDFTHALLESKDGLPGPIDVAEAFVRNLYREVKDWLRQGTKETAASPCLILDDVSALADVVGSKLAYAFIFQIVGLLSEAGGSADSLLLIRCAGDGFAPVTPSHWVGAGGDETEPALPIAWETCLCELADWVMDVLPLPSGYTREAHGRLLGTPRRSADQLAPVRYNYCLTDQAVFAIRLSPQIMR
jgi:hypothetical protein